MGNLSNTIPFTELWERLLVKARIDSPNNEDYARGVINDVYTRMLPRLEDWEPLIVESFISTSDKYTTGSVTISAGSTSLTGVGTTWTSAMVATDGYKIKFTGNDNIYSFTYASGTTATISPALSGSSNIVSGSYTIFKDVFELASDFDRFLQNGSVYVYSNGRLQCIVPEVKRDTFRLEQTSEPSDPVRRCMLVGAHSTTGNRTVRLNPPPSTSKVYPYDYVKQVSPMTDYISGSVAVTNGSPTVTGTSTSWSANVSTGDYFRVDGNGIGDSSKWYKIASVDSDTQITLEDNYGEATESGMEYSCSAVPSAFPKPFHEFILEAAMFRISAEQGDQTLETDALQRNEILLDLKKNYKNRNTNVQIGFEDGGYRNSWQ